MSIHLMSLVWEINFPTPMQKLIALRLADYANDDGDSIFPAVETLARQVGCSKRQAQYAVKAFEMIDLMRQTHKGGGGPGDVNRWKLNADLICDLAAGNVNLEGGFDCLKLAESKGANTAPLTVKRVQSTAKRVQSTTKKGEVGCTQPIINHQLEPKRGRDASDGIWIDDGRIQLDAKQTDFWLPRFGGDQERLSLALIEAAAYVQPNSNRSVFTQVSSQLARRAADKRDRDSRYSAASGKPKPDAPRTESVYDRMARESGGHFVRMPDGKLKFERLEDAR